MTVRTITHTIYLSYNQRTLQAVAQPFIVSIFEEKKT